MSERTATATELLYQEASLVDGQEWEQWLDLFTDDALFWMPAWKSEHALTSDPKRELSFIYCRGRGALQERVWRLRSGNAPSVSLLPRTQHNITNVIAQGTGEGIFVRSNWCVNQFSLQHQTAVQLFGRYEHRLVNVSGRWRISEKKIVLLNDTYPVLDLYNI